MYWFHILLCFYLFLLWMWCATIIKVIRQPPLNLYGNAHLEHRLRNWMYCGNPCTVKFASQFVAFLSFKKFFKYFLWFCKHKNCIFYRPKFLNVFSLISRSGNAYKRCPPVQQRDTTRLNNQYFPHLCLFLGHSHFLPRRSIPDFSLLL